MPAPDGGDDAVWISSPGEGLRIAVVSARNWLIAAWRSTIDLNTPCLSRRLASLAKKPSTAFSQLAGVGVKWKTHRGWRSSQARNRHAVAL